ncbi:MAG: type 2 isopentenyl-diphosphate Delta-isomerase [Promethearchaeota archaeon]
MNEKEERIDENRKFEHLKLIYGKGMQARKNWMEDVFIHPEALPRVDYSDVDTRCILFERDFNAPIFVAAMTGGHPRVTVINEILARACSERNIPLGLGSQRVGLQDPSLVSTYKIARDVSDDLFLIGNIGISQLAQAEDPIKIAVQCIEMIEANALAIHMNKLQELIQPEGDRLFSGILDMLENLIDNVDIPVILKEVGTGFSRADCEFLTGMGIGAIDVGGYGGTNFTLVEGIRENTADYSYSRNIGRIFEECGTPTPISVLIASKALDVPVLATGGIRSGLDVVKSISLGARMSGIAYPFLKSSMDDADSGKGVITRTLKEIDTFIHEIKISMVLLNAKSIEDLHQANVHLSSELARWME